MRATLERRWKMKKITVDVKDLLQKIQANREIHVKDYEEAEEAFAGYKLTGKEALAARAKEIKKAFEDMSKRVESFASQLLAFHSLKVPVSHVKDYDQVIMMLQMTVDTKIEIESDQFACYVMDDWDWKQEFVGTTNVYKSFGLAK
jgi:hypothetical protein